MPANAFDIVKSFEREVANYTGAPYCVAVNSCTNALFLALKYHNLVESKSNKKIVEVPKKTYVSVPMQIIHAGFKVGFRDQEWRGAYRLRPLNVWDSARRFTSNMFEVENVNGQNHYMCLSFHWSKILGVQQGGAIIHNDPKFDEWARRARFNSPALPTHQT